MRYTHEELIAIVENDKRKYLNSEPATKLDIRMLEDKIEVILEKIKILDSKNMKSGRK